MLSWSLLTKPRIESDKFQDVDRLEIEALGDPIHSTLVNEPKMILPEMEKRQRGTPLGDRVAGRGLVNFGQEIRRDPVRLPEAGGRICTSVHEAL